MAGAGRRRRGKINNKIRPHGTTYNKSMVGVRKYTLVQPSAACRSPFASLRAHHTALNVHFRWACSMLDTKGTKGLRNAADDPTNVCVF